MNATADRLVQFLTQLRGLNHSLHAFVEKENYKDSFVDYSALNAQYERHLDQLMRDYADVPAVRDGLGIQLKMPTKHVEAMDVEPKTMGDASTGVSKPAFSFGASTNDLPSFTSKLETASGGFSFAKTDKPESTVSGFTFNANSFALKPTLPTFGTTTPSVGFSLPTLAQIPKKETSDSEAEPEEFQQVELRNTDLLCRGEGEEEERTVHEVRAKAFQKDKEDSWQVIGVGLLKLNQNIKEPAQYRLISRVEGSGKLLLNARLCRGLAVQKMPNKKDVLAAVQLDGKITRILLRTRPEDSEGLYHALDEARKA
jgi:hypothetical protein